MANRLDERIALAFAGAQTFTDLPKALGPAALTPGVHRGSDDKVYAVRRLGARCTCGYACGCVEYTQVVDPAKLTALAVPTLADKQAASRTREALRRAEAKFWRQHDL